MRFGGAAGRRAGVVVLTLVLGGVAGLVARSAEGSPALSREAAAALGGEGQQGSAAKSAGSMPGDRLARALEVLREWDRRRAAAYSSGDVRALRRLYTATSLAGRADVRLLREYVDRGLVVEGMGTQLLEARLLSGTPPDPAGSDGLGPTQLVLWVRDRLVGATAVDRQGRERLLPEDRPSARLVTLAVDAGRWRVSAVRAG